MLQTSVHSDAEAISTDFLSRKIIKVSVTSSTESNWTGFPVEENIEGGGHESFDFQVIFLIFIFRQGNYWGITRELLGNYWEIIGGLLGN